MKDEPCVIEADFTTWRPVQGRKVVQLVFEIPIEQTHEVMTKLGVPMPGESKWCAIVLLQNGKCAGESFGGAPRNAPKLSETSEAGDGRSGNTPAPTNVPIAKDGTSQKSARKWNDLSYAEQAGMRSGEPSFWEFSHSDNAEEAAQFIRERCGVTSRAHIKPGTDAEKHWRRTEDVYQAWLNDRAYAEVRR